MSTVEIIILIVAAVAVFAILGVGAHRQARWKIERRPPPDDRTEID